MKSVSTHQEYANNQYVRILNMMCDCVKGSQQYLELAKSASYWRSEIDSQTRNYIASKSWLYEIHETL